MNRTGTGESDARLIVNARCFTYQSPIAAGSETCRPACSILMFFLLARKCRADRNFSKVDFHARVAVSFKRSFKTTVADRRCIECVYGSRQKRIREPQDPP